MKLDQTKAFEPASSSENEGTGSAGRFSEWSTKHPILAIMLVSLLAVVINCYPIIFCGRSYVSPACVEWMVYDWSPPLPGMDPARYQNVAQHGSDVGAMMWWGVPIGFVESRGLLEHGEIPLWNRYSHAGDTLIGQAVSMLGDPLQLIVILGRGSAGAWDVKFLAAKFLFCAGFGLLIRRLLGSRPLSLIYAALAAYCGAFFFINNHPVFFVFCYAPWILLSALAWLDVQSGRHIRWGLVWLLVNFACFNAGHVEAAVVLIGGLNLTAVAYVLARHRKLAGMAAVLGRVIVGTILFLGLTAPMWMSFLAALDGAYTLHSEVRVTQLPYVTLLGVFDDLFFLLPLRSDAYAAIAPGTSLLVMVGYIFSALRWRQLRGETFFWVNTGAIMLWGGCVFGWVPAPILAAIPLLNRVGHIYTDFSYLLVIQLTIQSAFGFKCLAEEKDFRRAAVDFFWVGLIFGGMLLMYCFGITHNAIPWDYVLCVLAGGFGMPLLFAYLKSVNRPITVIGWAGIIFLGFVPQFRFGLYTMGSDDLLMLPGPRAVLDAPSKAIDKIRADKSGPFRVVGMNWAFAGDYSAVYNLEDIRSCAPLSNGEFINLVRKIPGVEFGGEAGWAIRILNPVAAQPLLNLLNVKYLLARPDPKTQVREGLDFRITDRSDFLVLENLQAWPRAFFSDKVSTNSSTEEFIQQLSESSKQPFVSLSEDEIRKRPGLQALENTRQASIMPATHYRLLPNSTAFDVHAPSAGVVFLAEGQARDFTAMANGEPKEVLTVNRAFKGVYLDKPGDYHVEFIYRPRHWRLACALFWISIGGVIILALMAYASSGCRSSLAFDTDPAKN
jgi:hypothetical protein